MPTKPSVVGRGVEAGRVDCAFPAGRSGRFAAGQTPVSLLLLWRPTVCGRLRVVAMMPVVPVISRVRVMEDRTRRNLLSRHNDAGHAVCGRLRVCCIDWGHSPPRGAG